MDDGLISWITSFSDGHHHFPMERTLVRGLPYGADGLHPCLVEYSALCKGLHAFAMLYALTRRSPSFFPMGFVCFRWFQALFGLVTPYSPMHFAPFQRNKHPIQLINRFSDGPHTIPLGSALAPEHCITQWTNVFFSFPSITPFTNGLWFLPHGSDRAFHGLR